MFVYGERAILGDSVEQDIGALDSVLGNCEVEVSIYSWSELRNGSFFSRLRSTPETDVVLL
jgi:hypothetical protein